MIAMMRAQQLAPALLLLLILLAAAAPLVPALSPQEIRDRKINGGNKLYAMSADPADAYAGGEKKPPPESKVEATPKETSYVKGAGSEPKPESKGDEKVLEAKINAEVKQMRKEADYDDAIVEMKAKELKSKSKNTTDDAEDQGKDKKSKSKGEDGVEKKSKSKVDYSSEKAAEKEEKKEKKKDEEESEEKNKAKIKSEDDEKKKEKKSKSKDEDNDEKKEKKSKSKEEEDTEKKSKTKSGGGAYEFPGAGEKKPKEKSESSKEKKKESKSKDDKEDDFDAVPVETKADESTPAADTPDAYTAPPAKKTPPAYQAPTVKTMSASDSPDGYLPAAPTKAAPTMVPASDSPDGYAAPTMMSASDSPDGDVPAASYTPDGSVLPSVDSPDGEVPAASDSPDGYTAPSSKKVNVQSFEEYVPKPVLDMLSPTVKSLCAKTRFPYRCETSIAKLPETTVVPARQKDGLGVLTLAVDAVRAKIAEAKNAAKDIAVDSRTDKVAKSAISDCMAMYDDIGTSYDTGMAALKRGDRATAATAFDAARTFVDTCDQGFLDLHRGEKPVMASEEKVLAELSSNVLAINRYAQAGGTTY